MLEWVSVSPAERRLLPGGRMQGPTPWVIAIMMFVMVVIAAAGLSLANTAGLVARGVQDRFSVQIANGSAKSALAVKALKTMPEVRNVRPVPAAEMRETLERWLGPEGAQADLPLPALIDVDLKPGSSAHVVAKRVETAIPGARFVAHSDMLGPMLRALRSLTWVAFAIVLLIASATAAAVVLAARSALAANRPTIEVMHGVGATDNQVARLFQRRIAIDSLAGGAAGATAAGLVLLLIAGGRAAWVEDLAGGPLLGLGDLLFLGALPLAGTILATLVARFAVLSALREAL